MITTEWEIGSVQDVAWSSRGSHKGGYTYRLCQLGSDGRPGITEECFASNVLSFASNFTMIKSRSSDEARGSGSWEKLEQTDLREGTHPENSVWRPVGKVVHKWFVISYFANPVKKNSLMSIPWEGLFVFQLAYLQANMSSACLGMCGVMLRSHLLEI